MSATHDLESLLARYNVHFSSIEDGWYDETSRKPTIEEIENFTELIRTIATVHNIRHHAAVPDQEGGIWIDWNDASMHVHENSIRVHFDSSESVTLPAKEMIKRFRNAKSFHTVDLE
jgi:hypothetical protein